MSKIKFNGPFGTSFASFLTLNRIAVSTFAQHLLGKRMEPSWDAYIEIGIRFWRHQFTKAMSHPDINVGRQIFDSLQTETDDIYPVRVEECATPNGHWYQPNTISSDATILYLHGGGYTFHGAMSARFASMLAHHNNLKLFAPDYRLTPEHPHPAQAEDALAAWHYVTQKTPADRIIVIGDSAGGHMALSLLQTLKSKNQPQPALCIGLCPWTDIGPRGQSLHANDQYDLVQGWMALQFGEWLDPENQFGRDELSPISYDYAGLAPIYLQAGGREILRDMIIDFANVQAKNGADILLDLWDDMPHEFQAYDTTKASSREANARIRLAIKSHLESDCTFTAKEGLSVAMQGKFVTE
ncbi:alpha/beta hydrolase [Maritalea sp.]|uniref:alpha/beta hydrolase n=1 Tax=Maritalea sp. TaxID=2003361 RepID=UPI003EF9006D